MKDRFLYLPKCQTPCDAWKFLFPQKVKSKKYFSASEEDTGQGQQLQVQLHDKDEDEKMTRMTKFPSPVSC